MEKLCNMHNEQKTAQGAPNIIEVKNITKEYREGDTLTKVLQGVSFTVPRGQFLSIMGPSGSGKSTLLHILGFLDPATSGTYLFDGKDSNDYKDDAVAKLRNKKIGFVFQAFNLLPRTSVLENVMLPLAYSDLPEKEWKQIATEALESVGLGHRLEHEPSELSGGEKQRVAIARALVNSPEIIFADEPTGNLDSKSGQIVLEILERLNKEKGHTIVLITHETATAERAERIIRVRDGVIESDEKVLNRRSASSAYQK